MQLPRIQFTRSEDYEGVLQRPKKFREPSDAFMISNIRKLDLTWQKYEKDVLSEISRVLGMPWKEKQINVYMTNEAGYFSKPLTLSIIQNGKVNTTEWLFQTLIHELIHRIYQENTVWDKIQPQWKQLFQDYSSEKHLTKTHLLVHAVHNHIYLKLFTKAAMNREKKVIKKYPEYARSWQIVEKVGYENIIRYINPKFRK